jgi:hyperosmotically inducible protein
MQHRRFRSRALGVLSLGLAVFAAACTPDILVSPKTLIDRAIEARSAVDIAEDNRIVLVVNGIMAELGTIKASTEIYEQRLLVTGMFDDKALYDSFKSQVAAVAGVKKLYWHVMYVSKEEQKRRKDELIDWAEAIVLDSRVGLELVGARGIADVNFRVAADAASTVYLIGRARSREEHDKAQRLSRATEGVKKLINYVEVRP